MASNRIFSRVDVLLQHFTPDQLVDEIFQCLSDTEADSVIDHIERMWDIGDEEEEDYEHDEDDDDFLDSDVEDEIFDEIESEVDDEEDNVVNKILTFRRKSEE